MEVNTKNKSFFIIPASMIVAVLFLFSVYQGYMDWSQRTAWVGAAIAALPLPLLLLTVQFSPLERTSENLPSLLALAGGGFVIALWQQVVELQSSWGPTMIAGLGALIFVLYVFWYSRFGRIASGQLSVGSVLPDFTLLDANGTAFNSDSLSGSPAVIMFYRGNWCPFCVAQINEIIDRYKDLAALGAKVVMVSSQADVDSQKLAEKFDVPVTFLVDEGNRLATEWDIAATNVVPVGLPGDHVANAAMPTLIVVNGNGTIVFSDQTDNYRVRPEPDVFLAILRRSGAKS